MADLDLAEEEGDEEHKQDDDQSPSLQSEPGKGDGEDAQLSDQPLEKEQESVDIGAEGRETLPSE